MRRLIGISVELASHRLASCLRLTFALALVLGLLPRMGHAAPAEGSASPTAGAVYFDPDTMRFAGPLDTGSDRTAKVFTLLPGDSKEVEIIYWVKGKGEECPNPEEMKRLEQAESKEWSPPEGAVRRAALRGGGTADRFEFIATVGPLRVNVEYCFHLRAKTPTLQSDGQKKLIYQALRETLKAAKGWAISDVSPHAGTCKQETALSSRTLSRCELSQEFVKQLAKLDPDAAKWELTDPQGSPTLSVTEAFEQALARHSDFESALSDLIGSFSSLEKYKENRAKLEELAGASYDPLSGLELADVRKAAPTAVKQKYKDVKPAKTRAEWATILWSDREAFIAAKAWTKLAGPKQDTLREFFLTREGVPRVSQPPSVAFSKSDIAAILPKVPPDKPVKGSLQAVQGALKKLPDGTVLDGLPAKQGRDEVVSYWKLLGELESTISDIRRAEEGIDTLAAGGSPTAELLTTLQRLAPVKRFSRFAWEPTLKQRFPLYASADLGLAGTLIPIRGRDPRLDIVAYFGVNLYLTAVDKDEPVRKNKEDAKLPGRNFLRRFALMGGFSVVRPRINGDLGIAGILRNQVLLFGAGYRVFDYVRLGGGVMLYQQRSPNPLSDKTLVRTSPYISLSMDFDVIGTIRQWYDTAKLNIRE